MRLNLNLYDCTTNLGRVVFGQRLKAGDDGIQDSNHTVVLFERQVRLKLDLPLLDVVLSGRQHQDQRLPIDFTGHVTTLS